MAPRTRRNNVVAGQSPVAEETLNTTPTTAGKYRREAEYIARAIIRQTEGSLLCTNGEYTKTVKGRQTTRISIIGWSPKRRRIFDDMEVKRILRNIPRFKAIDNMIAHLLRGVGVSTAVGRPVTVEGLANWIEKIVNTPVGQNVDINDLISQINRKIEDNLRLSGIDLTDLPTKEQLEAKHPETFAITTDEDDEGQDNDDLPF